MTHPRETTELVGQEQAEAVILDAVAHKRLHHAWLISGPKGIGKATLAYRFARFLLAGKAEVEENGLFADALPPASLAIAPDDPVLRRIAAESHPDLKVFEREVNPRIKALRDEIVIDQVRELAGFFALTPAEGGYRVAIIDSADEMNHNAANALLKLLEEPPARSVLLLIAHAPGRLLPTIRSRCRKLTLRPLSDPDVARVLSARGGVSEAEVGDLRTLLVLSEGSPGRAMALAAAGGSRHYETIVRLLSPLADRQSLDVKILYDLGDKLAGREGRDLFQLTIELLALWLGRMVRLGAGADPGPEITPGEYRIMTAFAGAARLERWTEVWEKVISLGARTDDINLDRRQVIVALFSLIERTLR